MRNSLKPFAKPRSNKWGMLDVDNLLLDQAGCIYKEKYSKNLENPKEVSSRMKIPLLN